LGIGFRNDLALVHFGLWILGMTLEEEVLCERVEPGWDRSHMCASGLDINGRGRSKQGKGGAPAQLGTWLGRGRKLGYFVKAYMRVRIVSQFHQSSVPFVD
jgi:hypothetical protein